MNTTVELVLEDTILDDTLRCAGGHTHCGVDATHALTWCGGSPVPVCTPYVERDLPYGVAKGLRCGECGRRIADCWKAVPI
jgi:hypothetical protein